MADNRLARAVLEQFTISGIQYSPAVIICKNHREAASIFAAFRQACENTHMVLLDGCPMLFSGETKAPTEQSCCVVFQNLQVIAGNRVYEERFFHLFNALWKKVPMIITLNEYAAVRTFEERNRARLLCGTLAEIR